MMNGRSRNLKKEGLGRGLMGEQRVSGMSIRAWCRDHGVSESSLHWWRRRLAQRDAEQSRPAPLANRSTHDNGRVKTPAKSERVQSSSAPPVFLPVCMPEDEREEAGGRIEIVLTDGRCVRLSGSVDRQRLTDVLSVLEHATC
jgi:transposase-like protein